MRYLLCIPSEQIWRNEKGLTSWGEVLHPPIRQVLQKGYYSFITVGNIARPDEFALDLNSTILIAETFFGGKFDSVDGQVDCDWVLFY